MRPLASSKSKIRLPCWAPPIFGSRGVLTSKSPILASALGSAPVGDQPQMGQLDAVSGKTVPQTSQVILLMDVPPHHGLPAGQATDDPSFSLPVAMPQVPFYRQIISPFFPDYKRDSPNPFWYFFLWRAFLPLPVFSSAQKAAQLRFVHRKVLIFRRFSGMIWGLRRRSICPKNRWPLPFWMGSG